MKVLKLNKRYKMFKEHHHTVGLKFATGYSKRIPDIESCLRKLTNQGGWFADCSEWRGYFGTRNGRTDVRPYFITMRDEKLLSMVLLSIDNE